LDIILDVLSEIGEAVFPKIILDALHSGPEKLRCGRILSTPAGS
jgi:hypothetical protein